MRAVTKTLSRAGNFSHANSTAIEDAERIYEVLKGLFDIQPLPSIKEAKLDKRSQILYWDSIHNAPSIMHDILKPVMAEYQHEEADRCIIRIGAFTRNAPMEFPPPDPITMNRVICNFGEKELYRLESLDEEVDDVDIDIGDKISEATTKTISRWLLIPCNHKVALASSDQCNGLIKVSSKSRQPLPDRIENGRITAGGAHLRKAQYFRITVMMDLLGTEEEVKMLGKFAKQIVNKTGIQEKINEMSPERQSSISEVEQIMREAKEEKAAEGLADAAEGGKKKRKKRARKANKANPNTAPSLNIISSIANELDDVQRSHHVNTD